MEGDTGQNVAATDVAGGGQEPAVPLATEPQPGATAPPAGEDATQALQLALSERDAELKEQRAIQAGLDKSITDLSKTKAELEAEQARLKAEIERLNEVAFAGDDVKARYEQDLTDARAELAKATEQTAELQRQLEAQVQASERLRIMASEFPALASLLEVDALPQAATVDEFRQKMTVLAERLVPTAQAQAHARAQGARPPASPPASPPADMDNLATEMQAALRDGDMKRFSELREQWYAATETFK